MGTRRYQSSTELEYFVAEGALNALAGRGPSNSVAARTLSWSILLLRPEGALNALAGRGPSNSIAARTLFSGMDFDANIITKHHDLKQQLKCSSRSNNNLDPFEAAVNEYVRTIVLGRVGTAARTTVRTSAPVRPNCLENDMLLSSWKGTAMRVRRRLCA